VAGKHRALVAIALAMISAVCVFVPWFSPAEAEPTGGGRTDVAVVIWSVFFEGVFDLRGYQCLPRRNCARLIA
jgi:hypothetical protein